MNSKLSKWLLVLIWCGLIFCFTASPMFTGDNTAHWIKEIMQKLHIGVSHHINDGLFSWNYVIRKLTHLTAFGTLSILLWRALKPWRYAKFAAWVLTVLYAASDEWHQSFNPGRAPELTDVVIDACGAFVALFILVPIVKRIWQKTQNY